MYAFTDRDDFSYLSVSPSILPLFSSLPQPYFFARFFHVISHICFSVLSFSLFKFFPSRMSPLCVYTCFSLTRAVFSFLSLLLSILIRLSTLAHSLPGPHTFIRFALRTMRTLTQIREGSASTRSYRGNRA